MARVNLKRRAEIASAKRARTRAEILKAARLCYTAPAAAPMTVEAVMQKAGLAKGTFYVHFDDLLGLEAELGDTLIQELDERLQPARLAAHHPLTRLATALTILLRHLAGNPAQARLVVRAAAALPEVRDAMRTHLREDLADLRAAGLLALPSVELAAGVVTALCVQALREIGDGQIDDTAVPDFVRAVLRALGCAPNTAAVHAQKAGRNAEVFLQQTAASGRPCS